MNDPLIVLAITQFLGGLFLVASLHKISAIKRFRAVVATYGLLPTAVLPVAALAVPVGEAAIGIALIVGRGWWRDCGAAAAATAFVGYALLIAGARSSGRYADCGCSFVGRSVEPGPFPLVRNAILAGLAASTLVPVRERNLSTADIAQAGLAALTFGLIYLAAEALVSRRDSKKRVS